MLISTLITAFINMYMHPGLRSSAPWGLPRGSRLGTRSTKPAKLRKVGLRSSYELDYEEGNVFLAISADRFPVGRDWATQYYWRIVRL